MNKYSLKELEALPTLHSGHWDNRKIETDKVRVLLSRIGIADGAKYDNGVTVLQMIKGCWRVTQEYEAT